MGRFECDADGKNVLIERWQLGVLVAEYRPSLSPVTVEKPHVKLLVPQQEDEGAKLCHTWHDPPMRPDATGRSSCSGGRFAVHQWTRAPHRPRFPCMTGIPATLCGQYPMPATFFLCFCGVAGCGGGTALWQRQRQTFCARKASIGFGIEF